MTAFSTIVVAIDFSDTSLKAVRFACDLARQHDAHLHVFHVVPDACLEPWTADVGGFELQRWNDDAMAVARRQIAEVNLFDLPAERVTRAVVLGSARQDIPRYAREHKADLLVLGTHGYGPIRRFLLGSVATAVLRCAPCPVITVPPASWRDERSAAVA